MLSSDPMSLISVRANFGPWEPQIRVLIFTMNQWVLGYLKFDSYPSHSLLVYNHWLVVSNIFLFSIIYGMSSFPLTNSYFSRWLVCTTNQILTFIFPFSWEFHLIPTDFHSMIFQDGYCTTNQIFLGLSENVGLIFPMIASHFS